MDIDANIIGRNGYNFLRQTKVIADKDKSELTLTERDELLKKLLGMSADVLMNLHTSGKYDDRNVFLSVLYSSIIAYINNTDLNKYIKISHNN